MKHVDEYRSTPACERLVDEIRQIGTRQWTVMEVCGGQTHGLLRHAIDAALHGTVELVHGPGDEEMGRRRRVELANLAVQGRTSDTRSALPGNFPILLKGGPQFDSREPLVTLLVPVKDQG